MLAKPRAYMIFPIAAASAAESGKIHSPQANFVVAPPHFKGATFNLSMSCYFRI